MKDASAMTPREIVQELDKLRARVLPETIQVELKYQSGSYMVNGDPTRLQQVFMNLAVNARDAMPEGGSLCFELSSFENKSADWQQHTGLPDGDWICVTIRDTGRGISPEVLPYIYDPFFTTKEPGKGTGLGLSQVKKIIDLHQGTIDIISKKEEGTTVRVFLPMKSDGGRPVEEIRA